MQSKAEDTSTQWLIPRVDRPTGLDLVKALRDGVLTPEDYLQTVSGCRSCDDPAACARWIEEQDSAAAAPGLAAAGCRNAALVTELRAL
jgi:hypothetical protein